MTSPPQQARYTILVLLSSPTTTPTTKAWHYELTNQEIFSYWIPADRFVSFDSKSMLGTTLSWRICLLVLIFQHERLAPGVKGFTTTQCNHSPTSQSTLSPSKTASSSALFAAKKKKKKGKKSNSGGMTFGGFGGAAMESCPCGSGETYSACCSKVHKDVQFFRKATAEQIVRARYSAYAKKLPEFLMMSTHPDNRAFNPDLRAWKESIK